MSISNNIKVLLNIRDINIFFEDESVKEGQYKRYCCKYVIGKSSYDLTHCKYCGIKNEAEVVIKKGTQMSRITLAITGVQPTYLV